MGDTTAAVDQARVLELQNEDLRLQLEVEKLRQQRSPGGSDENSLTASDVATSPMEKSSAGGSNPTGTATVGLDIQGMTLHEQMEMAILPPMELSAMAQVTHINAALTGLENLNDFRDTCSSLYDDGQRGDAKVTTHQSWFEHILSTRSGQDLVKILQDNAGKKVDAEWPAVASRTL